MADIHHFGNDKYFLYKSKTATFTQFLMPITSYRLRKIKLRDLEKSLKMLILDPKMSHLPNFVHKNNFSHEKGFVTLFAFIKS